MDISNFKILSNEANIKIIQVIVFLLTFINQIKAQNTSIIGGITMSKLVENKEFSPISSYKPNIMAGLNRRFQLGPKEKPSLNVSILYIQRSFKYRNFQNTMTIKNLSLPVSLEVALNRRLFLEAGSQLDFLLSRASWPIKNFSVSANLGFKLKVLPKMNIGLKYNQSIENITSKSINQLDQRYSTAALFLEYFI